MVPSRLVQGAFENVSNVVVANDAVLQDASEVGDLTYGMDGMDLPYVAEEHESPR